MTNNKTREKQVESRDEQGNNRDENGRWKEGVSGNPNGRPPLEWSWAELLRNVGEEIEPKSGKQFKKLVSQRLWVECVNGNVQAIKELFNRMDGMPKQSHEHEGSIQFLLDESLKQQDE